MKLSTNEKLQDLYYYYDPVGNITRIRDDAQQTLFYSNSMISPDLNYTYDGLYRLIVASGRERIPQYGASPGNNWNDGPRVQNASMQWDGTRLQSYIDAYFYDDVGNRTFVAHQAGVDGGYSTVFSHTGNRLDVTYVVNDSTFYYNYDSRGNLVSLPHIPVMTYNRQNELWYAQVNDGMYNQYSGGQRIRKTVLKTGGIREERIYLGSYELYRKYDSTGAIDVERSTVHISDDTGRIAMYEALNTSYNSDGADAVLTRYIYSNHLGSASLELNETGDIISYEEYHPYGGTAYQSTNAAINATAKRYRYTGKERDEETGLYYHGARYYMPWLARWCAVDPLESKYSPQSSYVYGNMNPVTWNDPTGMGGKNTIQKSNPAAAVDNTGHAPSGPVPQLAPSVPLSNFPITPIAPVTLHPSESGPTSETHQKVDAKTKMEQQKNAPKPFVKPAPVKPTYISPGPDNPIAIEEHAEFQREMAFKNEMMAREVSDPVAHQLGTSPGVQWGLGLVSEPVGFVQGGSQVLIGIHRGDLTQVSLGAIGTVVSGVSMLKGGSFGYSFTPKLQGLPYTELSHSGMILTPYEIARQGSGTAVQAVRTQVEQGAKLFRIGKLGRSATAEGQFWSTENPLMNPDNYAKKFGMPIENITGADFIEVGTLKPGSIFITRPAPLAPGNPLGWGGGIEVVVPPNSVMLENFNIFIKR